MNLWEIKVPIPAQSSLICSSLTPGLFNPPPWTASLGAMETSWSWFTEGSFSPLSRVARMLVMVDSHGGSPAEGFLTRHLSLMTLSCLAPKTKKSQDSHFEARCRKSLENCGISYLEEVFSPCHVFLAGSIQFILEIWLVNKIWPRPCP